MAELSNDYRDCIAYKDLVIHYVDLYEKSLHISISVDFSGKDKYIKNYLSFAMFKLFFSLTLIFEDSLARHTTLS